LLGKFAQSHRVRSITRSAGRSFHQSRAFQGFASQIGNAALKFFCELALPTAKSISPRFDSVFVKGVVIERANSAPPIVIDETHGRFPPRAFPENAPFQNGRDYIVSILKNVRLHGEIFANDSLYRVTPAID
jgi:hypothetical protein